MRRSASDTQERRVASWDSMDPQHVNNRSATTTARSSYTAFCDASRLLSASETPMSQALDEYDAYFDDLGEDDLAAIDAICEQYVVNSISSTPRQPPETKKSKEVDGGTTVVSYISLDSAPQIG